MWYQEIVIIHLKNETTHVEEMFDSVGILSRVFSENDIAELYVMRAKWRSYS